MSEGAVIGSIVAEVTITSLYFFLARKYVNVLVTLKDALKYFAAAILMYFAVVFVKGYFPATISATVIEVFVGAAVYGVTLLILRDQLVFEYIKFFKSKLLKRGKK